MNVPNFENLQMDEKFFFHICYVNETASNLGEQFVKNVCFR